MENKLTIETSSKDKKIEFSASEFNELKHLIVTKIENGEPKEVRIIKLTSNKRLIMS